MADKPRLHRDNVPDARGLRKRMTPSERLLWDALRSRRFDNWKFRRQHPIGAYVLDFYCEELRLAVEIDGPVHFAPGQRERDQVRQEIISERGIWFMRIPGDLVEQDPAAALQMLRTTIQEKLARDPSP